VALDNAVAVEKIYPYTYRFRNRPPRAAIEFAQAQKLSLQDLAKYLAIGADTDPFDLELIWNIGVFANQIGNQANAKAAFTFASRLAPHNPSVAGALRELTGEPK